jgi:hypothetical protein
MILVALQTLADAAGRIVWDGRWTPPSLKVLGTLAAAKRAADPLLLTQDRGRSCP